MNSGIQLETSFNFLQWIFHFYEPKVKVGGQETTLKWGTTTAPFAPGRYDLEVWVPYMLGPACVAKGTVEVHPGHITGVKYETAFFVFSPGTLRVLGTKPYGA